MSDDKHALGDIIKSMVSEVSPAMRAILTDVIDDRIRLIEAERDRLRAVVDAMQDGSTIRRLVETLEASRDHAVAERDRLRAVVGQFQRAYRRHGFSDHPDEQPAPDPEWDAALRALAALDGSGDMGGEDAT